MTLYAIRVEGEDGSRASVREALEAFVEALEAGLFPPARVRSAFVEGGVDLHGVVPTHAFAVLAGMVAHVGEVFGPTSALHVAADGKPLDLLGATSPRLSDPLPRGVTVQRHRSDSTPPLEVHVRFERSVPVERRPVEVDGLWVWARLLQGGYSATPEPGKAAVGAQSIRFVRPDMLRYVADAWLGSPSAFVPLIAWATTRDVVSLEIEIG
jgi:hypothetical protein